MLVLAQDNQYMFANMSVSLQDNTVIRDDTITPEPPVPRFNMLIPTVQAAGITNTMELFYPGEPNRYLIAHGNPNPLSYGFGPDLIHAILGKDSGIGVYTVNLRGESATHANVILKCLYKVEEDVPYVDPETGVAYYKTPAGELTTEPTGNEPVVRDVLHVKYVAEHAPNIKKWTALHKYLNDLYNETEDADGYKCIPLFAIMYKGASDYGNLSYLSMTPKVADFDGNMYYVLKMFDGAAMTATDPNYSMDPAAGQKYNTTYFIENQFTAQFPTYRFLVAEDYSKLVELFNAYGYTVNDILNERGPSVNVGQIDIFNPNCFCITVDAGSVDMTKTNALQLEGGDDGTETADELYEKFFKGEIITDIRSVLRYRINYVPDVGYSTEVKKALMDFVNSRARMSVSTIMVGDMDSFRSALLDHQANYFDTAPCVRQIPAVQSPMMFNPFVGKTLTYPAGYFDTIALVEHISYWGNPYQPFAGYRARWTGYIEDTMVYPSETVDFINSLYSNRINAVMKDGQPGAYLNDQMMNTQFTSDQTEFNNALMIADMLYDLVNLVHRNHFKFNEASDVAEFTAMVDDEINGRYAQYSASLNCEVYRVGTVGRAKSTNKIKVTVNMRDINKFAQIELVLTDE